MQQVRRSFPEKTKEEVNAFAEKLLVYVVVGTVLGARLGHIFFYEHPMTYLSHPLTILKTWEGGLASHGAVTALLISVWLCKDKTIPSMTYLRRLDFMAAPAMLVAAMIRMGNFFNQEILGVVTNKPWGIVFGHPSDGGALLPRHPAQLYEAFFYALFFGVLWVLSKREWVVGRLVGLMLTGTFVFRFLIEFIKTEQSVWFKQTLLMGQILSLPLILLGLYLLLRKESERALD